MAEGPEYDKVTHASLNGIYVKAQKLDRGHNDTPAPPHSLPGTLGGLGECVSVFAVEGQDDAETHASKIAFDAETHASDVVILESDAEAHPSGYAGDTEAHASTHASDGA